jgi:hypothetical protein
MGSTKRRRASDQPAIAQREHYVPAEEELEELGRVRNLLSRAIETPRSYQYRLLKPELLALPARTLAHAAAEAIEEASTSRTFDRLARLLAEIGGDIAAETLAAQAFTQKRFPRLASRALAMCKHPSVLPALIELVSKGTMKQSRAAAKYWLRHQGGRGVEPLCHILRERRGRGAVAVEQVFAEIGGPIRLSILLLADSEIAPLSRVNGMHALEGVFQFDALRFLERQSRGWFATHKREAAEALEILRQRKMLLRPANGSDESLLMRAAAGPGNSSPDELLRASEPAGIEPRLRRGLLTRLAGLVSRSDI